MVMIISLTPTAKEKEWLKNAYINIIDYNTDSTNASYSHTYSVPAGYYFSLLKILIAEGTHSSASIQSLNIELKRNTTVLSRFDIVCRAGASNFFIRGDTYQISFENKPILYSAGEDVTLTVTKSVAGSTVSTAILGYKFSTGDYY